MHNVGEVWCNMLLEARAQLWGSLGFAGNDRMMQLVVDGMKQGVFRDVPPRLVVFGLLGMLNWVYKWYNPRGRWGAEEISSAFLSLVEGGLLRRARGGPALGRQLSRLRRDLQMLARALDA